MSGPIMPIWFAALMLAGLANDGSTLMVCRLGEPWDNRRYLTQEEMNLKKADFPEDTVFVGGGKMSEIRVTEEQIDAIMEKTVFEIKTVGEKTTILIAKLPNGFVIVESSSCVDPKNYNQDFGVKFCKERIRDKLWMLEGYFLQTITSYNQKMEVAKNELIDNVNFEFIGGGSDDRIDSPGANRDRGDEGRKSTDARRRSG